MKWNFRFLDLLLIIATGLIAWTLQTTWALRDDISEVDSSMESLAISTDLRLSHLENERTKGERFTYDMGETVKGSVAHNRDMFQDHIRRTEPKIDDIHDAVTRNLP